MSEMVERVARALFVKAWGEPNYWSEEEDEMEKVFRPNARVAIEAMREPTEGQRLAMMYTLIPFCTQASIDRAVRGYTAMIEEALK